MNTILSIKKVIFFTISLLIYHFPCESTKIVASSIPKCGTFLLLNCIQEITGKRKVPTKKWLTFCDEDEKHDFLMTHAIGSSNNMNFINSRNFKCVLIIRDPRDQVVSMAHYLQREKQTWPDFAQLSFNDRLVTWILSPSKILSSAIPYWDNRWDDKEVTESFSGIDDFYRRYMPWMNHPSFYTTTFEKLIGPNGGGSKEDQIQEIINIAQHLEHPISRLRAEEIAIAIFGHGFSFRQGQIGEHVASFTDEHKDLFKKEAGQLLIDLGYEKDFNW